MEIEKKFVCVTAWTFPINCIVWIKTCARHILVWEGCHQIQGPKADIISTSGQSRLLWKRPQTPINHMQPNLKLLCNSSVFIRLKRCLLFSNTVIYLLHFITPLQTAGNNPTSKDSTWYLKPLQILHEYTSVSWSVNILRTLFASLCTNCCTAKQKTEERSTKELQDPLWREVSRGTEGTRKNEHSTQAVLSTITKNIHLSHRGLRWAGWLHYSLRNCNLSRKVSWWVIKITEWHRARLHHQSIWKSCSYLDQLAFVNMLGMPLVRNMIR